MAETKFCYHSTEFKSRNQLPVYIIQLNNFKENIIL